MNVTKKFTLLELIVVIAVMTILIGIAVPSFTAMLAAGRVSEGTANVGTALSYGRMSAISKRSQVRFTITEKNSYKSEYKNERDQWIDLKSGRVVTEGMVVSSKLPPSVEFVELGMVEFKPSGGTTAESMKSIKLKSTKDEEDTAVIKINKFTGKVLYESSDQ